MHRNENYVYVCVELGCQLCWDCRLGLYSYSQNFVRLSLLCSEGEFRHWELYDTCRREICVCNISWYPPFVLQYNHDARVTQTLLPCMYIYLALLDFIWYNLIGIELVKLTVHLLKGDMYVNEEKIKEYYRDPDVEILDAPNNHERKKKGKVLKFF